MRILAMVNVNVNQEFLTWLKQPELIAKSTEGFLRDQASNDNGVIESVDFWGFGCCVFGAYGNEANVIIWYYLVPFPLTPKYMTLQDLECPFYVKLLLLRTALC